MEYTGSVNLTVNGDRHDVAVDPNMPLVSFLRNDLGLKGVRAGCGIGVCGSCTVLSDGQPIRSCNTPVEAVQGSAIVTPEGLGTPDQPHPVQAVFLEEQAAQCGYCINGIIMSTAAAVERGDEPTDGAPSWLGEHLCRCGTHLRVLRAVRRALSADAESAGGPWSAATSGVDPADASAWRRCEKDIPENLAADVSHEQVESWVRLLADGRIGVCTGKVELGQAIRSAMCQIAASQLGLPAEQLVTLDTATGSAPDEGYTAGSNSVDQGGVAIARAAVAFKRLLTLRAARGLEVSPTQLTMRSDEVVASDGRTVSFAQLASVGPLTGTIEADDQPDWDAVGLGEALRRDDLRYKLTGSPAYVHDLSLPGMLHARALLPPNLTATLDGLDVAAAEDMPGVKRVVVDARLIIVIADREEQAARAVARLQDSATWIITDAEVDSSNLFETMRSLDGERFVARQGPREHRPSGTVHQQTYSQPYQAHASIAPSCAVAHREDDVLRVHTHSQGVYQLRASLAAMLDLALGQIEVIHRDGPGCYGHNLADDAAAFAAIACLAADGSPVRFQFAAEDEFTWEPFGPAIVADLQATLDAEGHIVHWGHRALTDVHNTRPQGAPERLMPSWFSTASLQPAWPGAGEPGARNSVPIYDFPFVDAVADHVRGPLRSSALRALGAYLNIFAAESFMDEMAEEAGEDPLAFRLAHLVDDRARRVLELVAKEVGWTARVGPSGRGVGLAVARYKDSKAYVAAAVEATVDSTSAEVTVGRVVLACDAGTIVNTEGARQQLEGGALQGLSRALHEEVCFDRRGVTSRDWLSYPVIGFAEVPEITVALVDAQGQSPLGVGEASIGQTAAALGNAIDDATGIRLRQLPLTPKRITDRLFGMTDEEAARVIT